MGTGTRVNEGTGKVVVFITAGGNYDVDKNLTSVSYFYNAYDGSLFGIELPNADVALQEAQAAVAASGDPGKYVIVDLTR
jgi:hypothetical protein